MFLDIYMEKIKHYDNDKETNRMKNLLESPEKKN